MPTDRGGARLVLLALLCLAFAAPAPAATPSSGTISPGNGPLVFTGGPFDFTNQTAVPATPAASGQPPVCLDPLLPCDDFALTVSVTPGDPAVYFLRVDLQFVNTASDFDLYLFDSTGAVVKESAGSAGEQEGLQIQAQPGTHTFTVQVVPYDSSSPTRSPPSPRCSPPWPAVPATRAMPPPPGWGTAPASPRWA